jgi:hypothetical protein
VEDKDTVLTCHNNVNYFKAKEEFQKMKELKEKNNG